MGQLAPAFCGTAILGGGGMDMLQGRKGRNEKYLAAAMQHACLHRKRNQGTHCTRSWGLAAQQRTCMHAQHTVGKPHYPTPAGRAGAPPSQETWRAKVEGSMVTHVGLTGAVAWAKEAAEAHVQRVSVQCVRAVRVPGRAHYGSRTSSSVTGGGNNPVGMWALAS